MFNALLHVLFPTAKRQDIRLLPPTRLALEERSALRASGVTHLDRLTAAGPFHDASEVRKVILRLKYSGRIEDAHMLARHFHRTYSRECSAQISNAILCPVPLHWTRKLMRGFNQSALLANELSSLFGIPARSLLRRRHMTGHQSRRTRAERLNAFGDDSFVAQKRCEGFDVILVDDVATTGATSDACARALKGAGARYVEAWVMAHDVHS